MTLPTPRFNRPRRFHTHRAPLISPVYLVLAVGVVSAVLFSCTSETVRSNTWESAASMRYSDAAPSFRGNPGAANIGTDVGSANAGAKGPDRRFVNTWSSHEGAPRITRRAWLSQTSASR